MNRGQPGLHEAASAFGLPLRGLRLLLRERSLWGLAVVPLLLSVAACAAAAALIVAYAGELRFLATGWIPALVAERWFHWIWVAPAKLVLAVAGWLLFAVLAAACLALAFLIASLAAAPFHDALSRRVERVVTGHVLEAAAEGWRGSLADGLRSILGELRRLVLFLLAQAAVVGAGLLLPGAALLAPIGMALLTMFFLPLDYASHVLERRRVLSFRDKRRWLVAHASSMLGFGAAAFLICLVPGLNLLAMPALVAGGTLLALRHAPDVRESGVEPVAASRSQHTTGPP